MDQISRDAARAAGLVRYFTGEPCVKGHLAARYVSRAYCVECVRLSTNATRAKSADKHRHKAAAYYAANRERVLARQSAHVKANRAAHTAKQNKRRAALLKATPQWANDAAIRKVYEMADRLGMTVDHIVPLRGRNVCGLHVEHNLQLLTKSENSAKGNKFEAGGAGLPGGGAPQSVQRTYL